MNKHTYRGIGRHIYRHITRATLKSILVILVTFGMLLTLGWLQETIDRNDSEINRLYETNDVFGRILPEEPGIYWTRYLSGNIIRRQTIDEIIASDLMIEIYFEATTPFAFVTDPDVFDTTILNEILDVIVGSGYVFDVWQHREFLDELIAIEQLSPFIERLAFTPTPQVPGATVTSIDIDIEFASGFDQDSFVYPYESLEAPVPVILSEGVMMRSGFDLGDTVSIWYNLDHSRASWQQMTAVVIGVHHHTTMIQDIFLPISAWEFAQGANATGFSTLEFTIDPMLNRELPTIRESIEDIITKSGASFEPLTLDLLDEEIRFVARPMEQNVSLLWMLYPVVVAVSMMIAGASSFFLTLQNAKNVATMRIFGTTKKMAGLILWIEQIILCLIGLALVLCLLAALGWGFGILELFTIAGLYLLSSMIGSAAGVVVITRQAPLELLQVKE